jgi:hypothetical protein
MNAEKGGGKIRRLCHFPSITLRAVPLPTLRAGRILTSLLPEIRRKFHKSY